MQKRFELIVKAPDNWILSVLGTLGVVFFSQTYGYRTAAALFPRLVSMVVASLCFYQLGENIWRVLSKGTMGEEKPGKARHGLAWFWCLGIVIVYYGLIHLIGFVLGTGVFLVIFPIASGYRRWLIALIVAVTTAIATVLSFSVLLQLPLPEGIFLGLFR